MTAARQSLDSRRDDLRMLLTPESLTVSEVLGDESGHISDDVRDELRDEYADYPDFDMSDCGRVGESIMEAYREALHDYGLCFDYVEFGTFGDQNDDYFRYQISWGGPSEEIRFYANGAIEFVYLDWFVGAGFSVTRDSICQALRQYLTDCGMLDWTAKREESDYYTRKAEAEADENDND